MVANTRFIQALKREPVDRTPVWLMRQAGRYLPEYRKIRAKSQNFMTMCKTPELAAEVTLQPLARFNLDAAIIFSDILTIPDALGLGLDFIQGEGPKFAKPITNIAAINKLRILEPEQDLNYVMDAIKIVSKELAGEIPLIGFAGSPWTVATYMVEGGSSKNFSKIKSMLYAEPDALHKLLDILAKNTINYLQAQIIAGADVIMLFDTWGGVLSHNAYLEFSLRYMQQIIASIPSGTPSILFTKNGGKYLTEIAASGCYAIGLDWTADLQTAKSIVGDKVALQGNLDPCILYAPDVVMRQEVAKILNIFGNDSGHIFNLGHGMHPDMDPAKVEFLVNTVHELSGR